jgi:hypothetical protein
VFVLHTPMTMPAILRRVARPVAVLLVAVLVGVAACDGKGSAEPSSTSSAPSTASTTAVTTTTTVPTSAPTTSAAQALDAEKAKVEAAYRAIVTAHLNALTVLGDFDPATIRAVIARGPQLDAELQFVSEFRGKGQRIKLNEPDTTRQTVESISLAAADAASASLFACQSDNGVVYEPDSLPGPEDDVIVDDSQQAVRVHWEMVKESGKWLGKDHTTVGTRPGESACPPS